MAVTESTKILPYVIGSRKTVKLYLKVNFAYFSSLSSRSSLPQACLDMWSTVDDSVRIATIRAIHRLASAPDESILDLVLKVRARIQTQGPLIPITFFQNTYQTLLKSSKNTTAHSLPSITFMKNSASEIFSLNHQAAYQHAFRFIRQLAIHLRNSMKLKTKVCHISKILALFNRFAWLVNM
jgi:nucleolar complex protein 2